MPQQRWLWTATDHDPRSTHLVWPHSRAAGLGRRKPHLRSVHCLTGTFTARLKVVSILLLLEQVGVVPGASLTSKISSVQPHEKSIGTSLAMVKTTPFRSWQQHHDSLPAALNLTQPFRDRLALLDQAMPTSLPNTPCWKVMFFYMEDAPLNMIGESRSTTYFRSQNAMNLILKASKAVLIFEKLLIPHF